MNQFINAIISWTIFCVTLIVTKKHATALKIYKPVSLVNSIKEI